MINADEVFVRVLSLELISGCLSFKAHLNLMYFFLVENFWVHCSTLGLDDVYVCAMDG